VLTARQELILRKVVEVYTESGQPVGSKTLAEDPVLQARPSTIRNELAFLEEQGLLAHPHTSAGRVPTDAGHRYYVDRLLPAERTAGPSLELHVEVLTLQPQVLMVVIITSTGGVTKRIFTFEQPVDPGLASWAAAYLNERLGGMGLGARMLHSKLVDPELDPTERAFVERLAPAFTGLAETAEDTLYVDGAARLFSEHRFQDVSQLNELMQFLERRVALLGVLRSALGQHGVLVRIGSENEAPALRSLAVVAAGYGLPARPLGIVSVIGPVRMDYGGAIRSVRDAALQLSRFIEDVYGG
jgi:heat-inducible transcriptional repressor